MAQLGASLAAVALLATPAAAKGSGMKIQEVTSPGGIRAWLVESHANPLIALRFAFRGGASQDEPGKEGVAYFVTAMMDEGAGDLDSTAFQEREQGLAMRMDFDAGRDVMLGSLQTLTENKDEVFDLVRSHLAEELEVDPAKIGEETRFKQDLDADSLDLYELVMELEDNYGISVSEEQAARIETVGDAVAFVLEHSPA